MSPVVNFADQFEKSVQLVKERLATYMAEPKSDEKVHDVRVSLRRLDVLFLLMPKNLRTRNRQQITMYKKFFRTNSQVRDYDVIRGRIEIYTQDEFLTTLDKRRKTEVECALGMARPICALPPVSLKGLDDIGLERRMRKVADGLVRKIKKRLHVVTADENAVEELHELRKDLKKLRYMFEIMPEEFELHEKKISKILKCKNKQIVERLKELQDALGAMHDIDITVQYLAALRKRTAVLIIESEKTERNKLFNRFARNFRN